MKVKIKTKRIYDGFDKADGVRILVDRLWPRGMKKEDAKINLWMKDIAPSDELRKWFHHESEKWDESDRWKEFVKRYTAELNKKKKLCEELISNGNNITLLYSSKDEDHNQANVLKNYLEKNL